MRIKLTLNNGKQIEVAGDDYSENKIQRSELLKIEIFDGWRLPEMDELEEIYLILYKKGVGEFKDDWYWSSSYFDVSWDYSIEMGYNFKEGRANACILGVGSRFFHINDGYLRLVRDI